MFSIDDLLSDENQARALQAMASKRDGSGPDGLRLSGFADYWKANCSRIAPTILDGTYKPSTARLFEIAGNTGKRREIASINVLDRFVERLLQQKLKQTVEPLFLQKSFAYQNGKGTLSAAMQVRDYIASGSTWLCEVDVEDFFGSIDLGKAIDQISQLIEDNRVIKLVEALLHREVERDGHICRIRQGLLQGSAISPIIANLYLHHLDEHLESMGLNWLRYADNIYVYTETRSDAEGAYEVIRGRLSIHHNLRVNAKKSGIYEAIDRRVLGYMFSFADGGVEVRRHHYQPLTNYHSWHASSVHRDNGVYHIVQDGIINKKDYSLLFENEDERHYIPVEITDQINVYGNVTISPSAMRTISSRNIRISYFDEFGRLTGTYTPISHAKTAHVFLLQCELYSNDMARLSIAKSFEVASIHNMRANLKYYKKKGLPFEQAIGVLTKQIEDARRCDNVDSLMLIEARARREYYSSFSMIVSSNGFGFTQRTKQPPKDACNAMISFGNTVLYNTVLQMIWKTSLDPKIGIVHATNRRDYSLNLDFADIFKPIVVDRTIFALVNRHEIKMEFHFREADNGGVLLNDVGKRIFLERIESKLDSVFQRGKRRITYRQLMIEEIRAFQRMVLDGESYKPYKYY